MALTWFIAKFGMVQIKVRAKSGMVMSNGITKSGMVQNEVRKNFERS